MQGFTFTSFYLGLDCPVHFFSVSIAISSIFPPKLCFIDSCGLQDHFSPLPAPLMWLSLCTYSIGPISIYFLPPNFRFSDVSKTSPTDVPLSFSTADKLSFLPFLPASAWCPYLPISRAQTCLVCFGFISSSLPMSHCFLETCRAYCQVLQTCSLHSSSLAEPPKLPLFHPLYATSKMHTF